MDSLLWRCCQKDSYQHLLFVLLAVVRSRLSLLDAVSPYFLALFKNFGHLNYRADQSCWAREFYLESRAPKHQEIFGGYHNVDLFSIRALYPAKYYCCFPSYRIQLEVPSLLLVLSSSLLGYYRVSVVRGSATDHTGIWMIVCLN